MGVDAEWAQRSEEGRCAAVETPGGGMRNPRWRLEVVPC
jgi:hypothetical protein